MPEIQRGVPCAPEEKIVRAILTTDYDSKTNLLKRSLFETDNNGTDISVSRLAVLSVSELFPIFAGDLDTPPDRLVIQVGTIEVQDLIQMGEDNLTSEAKKLVRLSVIQDPCPLPLRGRDYKQYPISSFNELCQCSHNPNQHYCPENAGKATKPCPRNYAHAEIRGDKISKGLSSKIVAAIQKHLYIYPQRVEYVPIKTP